MRSSTDHGTEPRKTTRRFDDASISLFHDSSKMPSSGEVIGSPSNKMSRRAKLGTLRWITRLRLSRQSIRPPPLNLCLFAFSPETVRCEHNRLRILILTAVLIPISSTPHQTRHLGADTLHKNSQWVGSGKQTPPLQPPLLHLRHQQHPPPHHNHHHQPASKVLLPPPNKNPQCPQTKKNSPPS